uniref:Syntaxin-binding protein 5-like isoform X2 n=3 Tax=Hirondellea gigas TaxID=1518452 RepID=A0A6A7FXP2_9CRUS
MKKRTLKNVFDGFRSSVAQPSARTEHVPIVETLRSEFFQVAKTVRHGFPYQPTAMAYDPIQKILAVGTKHGSIRLIGRPGVDSHIRHENESAVLFLLFLVNEGALISATADSTVHMWNYRQKKPEVVHSIKFQRERIMSICLPFQSKWLYVGSERGNIHIVNVEAFTLSGYIINWNKAIDLSRKTHPGAVIHLSDCPVDPSKLLIGFESGQLVVWDLKTRTADCRYQSSEPLRSVSWHHEGKQFMCSHTDGSLTTWVVKQPSPKPTSTIFPHAKTNKEGKQESCKPIQHVEWTTSRTGESFIIFSGGLTNNHAGRTPSITVIHGKTTTVLEMEHNVVDFITLCESPWPSEFGDPYALVVLLHNDLVVVDLLSSGYPCFENPYSMDLHESPVTCCSYLADCPADLVPAFYSVGVARSHKSGFSAKEWPICGGEWGSTSCSYPELIITGHADGSIKFWDSSSVSLQFLYKLKTAKVFEKDKSRSNEGGGGGGHDEDPFAIQHISLCPESRLLCVAGSSSHLILYKYCKQETVAEVTCLEIPIVYDAYESGDYSPECEFPPRPSLQASLDYFVNIHVRGGVQKKPPGYQAELVCVTPWVNGEPPGQITSVSINSSYGLIAYGNESGLVIVDYIQNTCLLNMGTPELYGSADPYQRVPRSPKKLDSRDKDDDRDRSPSSDQDCTDSQRAGLFDEGVRGGGSGSREELIASLKPVMRIDTRGRGELDLQKNMIRKYSKVRDDHGGRPSEPKIDIMKFLTRKESKSKCPSKEERVSEYEEKAEENCVDDNFKKCHNKDGKGEGESEITRCESDDFLLCKDGDTPLESISSEEAASVAQITVECEESRQCEATEEKPVTRERKMSRFRLKDTFTKFDAKVRRAFSWETSTSLDGPASEFYDDTTMVVVGKDGEIHETTLEDVLETDIDEGEDALESIDRRTSSVSTTTSEGGSPVTSMADSSAAATDTTPKASRETTPEKEEESKPAVSSEQPAKYSGEDERRGSGNRASLHLFDEHGKPVPPPRRSVTLATPKDPVRKNSDEKERSNNLTTPSWTSHSQGVSPNERRKACKAVVSLNIGEARTYGETVQEIKNCEATSSMPHTPSGAHLGYTSVTTSSGMTSPTSLGAFRTFMSNITKKGSSHALHDKLDGSFSRSRSSSISSLENISSEAIQCLAFADSYVKKNDGQMLPTLWVGTSLGSVIQVIVSIPSADTRQTNPVSVFPSGTIFRLKGSILAMCFLDWNGTLIKNSFESWRDAQKDKKDRTPTKNTSTPCSSSGGAGTPNNRLSPTNSAGSTEQPPQQQQQQQPVPLTCADRQFIVFCSEKVARVVALPSQNCVYKQIITELSFVVKAEIIQMKDAVCLVCYVATGHISIFNLPSLRQLTYVDFLPLVDLRIARTFCFTSQGHGMYLCSPSEVQKFTLSADICKDLQELLGELFLACEMPEPPKQSFFKGLFGGGVSQLDREELFGESSGKAASSVAKHVPGPQAQMEMLNARAGTAGSEMARAKMAAIERGQRLGELDEKTAKMMNEAETFSSAARQLMVKYRDKKWYQL